MDLQELLIEKLLFIRQILNVYTSWIISFEKWEWSLFHLWLVFFWFDNHFVPVKRLKFRLFFLNLKIFFKFIFTYFTFLFKLKKTYLVKLFFYNFFYRPFFSLLRYFLLILDVFIMFSCKFGPLFIALINFLRVFITTYFIYPVFIFYILIYSILGDFFYKFIVFSIILYDRVSVIAVFIYFHLDRAFSDFENSDFFWIRKHKILLVATVFIETCTLLIVIFSSWKSAWVLAVCTVFLVFLFIFISLLRFSLVAFGISEVQLLNDLKLEIINAPLNLFFFFKKKFLYFFFKIWSFFYYLIFVILSPLICFGLSVAYRTNFIPSSILFFFQFLRISKIVVKFFFKFFLIILKWVLGNFLYFFLMAFYFFIGARTEYCIQKFNEYIPVEKAVMEVLIDYVTENCPNFFKIYWSYYDQLLMSFLEYFFIEFWELYLEWNDYFWCSLDLYIIEKIWSWFIFFLILYYYRELIKYSPHGILAWLKKKKAVSRRMSYWHIYLPNFVPHIVFKFLFFIFAPLLTISREMISILEKHDEICYDSTYWDDFCVMLWTFYWLLKVWISPFFYLYFFFSYCYHFLGFFRVVSLYTSIVQVLQSWCQIFLIRYRPKLRSKRYQLINSIADFVYFIKKILFYCKPKNFFNKYYIGITPLSKNRSSEDIVKLQRQIAEEKRIKSIKLICEKKKSYRDAVLLTKSFFKKFRL